MSDSIKGIFQGMDILASSLRAEMQRSEVVAANFANMSSTGNEKAPPYRRRSVVFETVLDQVAGLNGVAGGDEVPGGVKVSKVVEDQSEFPRYFDPGNPMAGADGFVWSTNVDMLHELVDMQQIERSFNVSLQAMRAYRGMLQNTISNITRS
jgi:flagellar basal-body rod protein FlgC